MNNFNDLIDLAKQTATQVVHKLSSSKSEMREIQHVTLSGKKTKITADGVSEEIIIKCLEKTGIPILSEELGYVNYNEDSDLLWIIDPLDGSLTTAEIVFPAQFQLLFGKG